MTYCLKRDSILKLNSEIQGLFAAGKREYPGIVKIIWKHENSSEKGDVKIFVSVPKRIVNKAVKRNLLKRRIKEALRLNLPELRDFCSKNNIFLNVGVVYIHSSIADYSIIEEKIILTLQKIYSKIYENS